MRSSQTKSKGKRKNLERRIKNYNKFATDPGYTKPGSMNK